MTDTPRDRPRPSPRPRPTPSPRPSPSKRVAGARRDRDGAVSSEGRPPAPTGTGPTQADESATEAATAAPRPSARRTPGTAAPIPAAPAAEAGSTGEEVRAGAKGSSGRESSGATSANPKPTSRSSSPKPSPTSARPVAATAGTAPRRVPALALVLALLCLAAGVGVGLLLWQRADPRYVDAEVLSATRGNVEDLYAYDYEDSEGSVQGKLDALTGDLRAQYETDLADGGIIDTYEQVSATTRYQVADVALQQVNEAQDSATLVVFGSYVVESATTGREPAPENSECQVTAEGAQSCVQTLQVRTVQVDGVWKISELTVLTTS